MSETELENGEFLILEDRTCHMVGQSTKQLQFTPSTLSLTNLHIFLNPQFDVEILRKIAISDITKFQQKTVDDSTFLEILSEDAAQSIKLFIPEETHRTAFVTLLNKLVSANELGQDKCNECALKYRRRLQMAPSLDAFYEMINSGPDEESISEKRAHENELQMRQFTNYFENLFKFCDYFADVVETSSLFFFIPAIIIGGILTLIMRYVNFGVFLPFILLALIIYRAILKNIGTVKEHSEPDFSNSPPNIKEFMEPITSFRQDLKARFQWTLADPTLQTCEFLLVLIIMFQCLDTFFILVASLIGLAFFERWDPFHIGSLSKFLSHLILW